MRLKYFIIFSIVDSLTILAVLPPTANSLLTDKATKMKKPTSGLHSSRRQAFTKTKLATQLFLALGLLSFGLAQAENLELNNARKTVSQDATYDDVSIDFQGQGLPGAVLSLSNFRTPITVTINGDFTANASTEAAPNDTTGSLSTLVVEGKATAKILGNVSSVTRVTGGNVTTGGANNFYTNNGGTLDVGSENTTTKIWSIGAKPDALTAKSNSKLSIHSTQNQIVGSVDYIDQVSQNSIDTNQMLNIFQGLDQNGEEDDRIKAYVDVVSIGIGCYFSGGGRACLKQGVISALNTFIDEYQNNDPKAIESANRLLGLVKSPFLSAMGENSEINMTISGDGNYWYGDEQNGANVYTAVTASAKNGDFSTRPEVGTLMVQGMLNAVLNNKPFNPDIGGKLNVTLRDGAQWTYFGIADSLSASIPLGATLAGVSIKVGEFSVKTRTIPKRISALTLEEGGIVNLYDENILAKWREIGLDQAFPEVMNVKHDYVRIGDLKGNGGIFRLDLTDDKANSDMIFVEKATGGAGTFKIEPYDPNKLTGISETNTLRFATVSAAAKDNITFVDSINIKGEQLKDYKLYIRKKPYDVNDPENATYEDKVYADEQAFAEMAGDTTSTTERSARTYYTFNSAVDFEGGENWEIYRFDQVDNENATNLHQSFESGWYYARTLDRLHQRLGEIRYADQGNKGLWARARYERLDQHSLNLDRTMVQIGTDFRNTDRNRIGIAFDYNWGDQDYDHMKGSSDLKGYSVLFYDTWLKENGAWIDLTASLGRQKIKSTTPWSDGTEFTSNYHQNVYKLGIEAGHKFDHQTDVATYFIEPQLQLQYTRVGSTSFTTSNDVNVSIDSAKSLIGRAGFRLGREWLNDAGRMNNVYLVADVLREFSNGQKGVATLGIDNTYHAWGGKSTWYDLGISTQMSLSERTALHLDLLKNFGAGYHNSWLANVNFRYTF